MDRFGALAVVQTFPCMLDPPASQPADCLRCRFLFLEAKCHGQTSLFFRQAVAPRKPLIAVALIAGDLAPDPVRRLKRTAFANRIKLNLCRHQATMTSKINIHLNSAPAPRNFVASLGYSRFAR